MGLAAGVIVLIATFRPSSPTRYTSEAPTAAASQEEMLDALVDRIAAESTGQLPEPLIQAAPSTAGTTAPDAESPPGEPPTPPDGFTFIAAPEQMTLERLQRPAAIGPASPDYYPAWLDASDAVSVLVNQATASGRDWTFGWIGLADNASEDDLGESLNALGGEIIGAAGRLIRARLPGDPSRLEEIASLAAVAGLGALPRTVKLPEALAREARSLPSDQQLPVFVTLMTGDPDGQWRRALENLGAVVGRFDSDIRVYTATVDWPALDAIADADFVLAIEPVGLVEAAHDTAVPAMGVDALRWYSGSPGLFSGIGGASVPIAVMDTGLNINHLDISSHRGSICGANFVWIEPRLSNNDLWVDENGHGTHVTGTIAGNGYVNPELAGMAPSVSHIRFAKVLHHTGFGSFDGILQGMDYLSRPSGCDDANSSADLIKPLIVNMSLSASANIFEGRGVGERKLDSVVWTHRQLYIVAQANAGSYGFSNYGAAKNSLAVGAALDSGELARFSSHGPTADGRLAPQVVATGVDVSSARGDGSRGGYQSFSGTSMAAPTVAGVAALLMDAEPAHREQPALTRARLMASAIRPDAWLEDPTRFPANNSNGPGDLQVRYGLGKVSARTSVLDRDQADGWISGGAISRIEDGDLASQDIVVPPDAGQLALVMTWDEPPTDTIASAVLNDLDLYLDLDGDCGTGACGEHMSVSRKDNVEWIILKNPPPGVHRAKIVAHRIYTEAPRAALAWTIIRGASTPSLHIETDTESLEQSGEITLTVTADAYVAAGTRLEVNCRTADGLCRYYRWSLGNLEVAREDGLEREIDWTTTDYSPLITLGEIAAGESQQLKLDVAYDGGGAARLYFTATAWNARPASASLLIRGSGAQETDIVPAERPANADFASAAALTDSPQRLDLLLAATEPGEPEFNEIQPRRPSNSAWYEWTAPVEGFYRFDVRPDSEDGSGYNLQLDLFQGDSLGTIEEVVTGDPAAVEFFSRENEDYKIRISHNGFRGAPPAILRWSRDPPANDLFADGVELEGEEDSIQGNNQGATLEAGESFGELAATVWYRWTAPDDGDWYFDSDNGDLRTLVFVGDQLSKLRLVSGYPYRQATFPAASGQEYRIAVAAGDAFGGGGSYALSWGRSERDADNDDFQAAEDIGNARSSSLDVEINSQSTVEPGEPVATGVRTEWFAWTAPEDGFYTWRLFDPDPTTKIPWNLALTVFAGDSLTDLELIGATDPYSTLSEFVFHAAKDQRYFISLGFLNNTYSAFVSNSPSSVLRWGQTPANDKSTNAVALTNSSGAISGSNEFATVEPGERGGNPSAASLWYDYEAPASGWVRFFIGEAESGANFSLAVYRRSGGDLKLISEDLGSADTSEVLFEAEAGIRYLIRLGTRGNALGGDFTLRWEESAPPVWLKYLGELNDAVRDANGHIIEFDPWQASLALSSDGTALFMATEKDLLIFERDPESGELRFTQLLLDIWRNSPALLWDSRRARLYANDCHSWRRFDAVDGNQRQLGDAMRMSVSGGDPDRYLCAGASFMDMTETFIHLVDSNGLQVFAVTPDGMEHVQTVELDGIQQALVSGSNTHIYALTESSLHVYERDTETGKLTPTRKTRLSASASSNFSVMAISDNDQYMFVVTPDTVSVFRLQPDADPLLLDELEQIPPYRRWACKFAAPRKGLPAADVFCDGFAFSFRWRPDTRQLFHTDYVGLDDFDRFDNFVRDFGDIRGRGAASSDGRHAYMIAEDGALMMFERFGNSEGYLSTTAILTSENGILDLPMAEYRDETETLCFTAEFHGTADSGNWLDAGDWTLTAAALIQCATATEDIPFVEAETGILRILYGKISNEDESSCFMAELQGSEDYLNWTLLAGNHLDCK